jgi:hypothetical protein
MAQAAGARAPVAVTVVEATAAQAVARWLPGQTGTGSLDLMRTEAMKRSGSAVGVALFLASMGVVASEDVPTRWSPLESSMEALLNEGWRITSSGIVRANYQSDSRNRFTFTLEKSSKFVICILDDPVQNDAVSACRALN